jgi:predicted type IV restriction endonuclease
MCKSISYIKFRKENVFPIVNLSFFNGLKEKKMASNPEAFSRVLIDHALEDSNWNLLDYKQVRFEFHTTNGRADYLLLDGAGFYAFLKRSGKILIPMTLRSKPEDMQKT